MSGRTASSPLNHHHTQACAAKVMNVCEREANKRALKIMNFICAIGGPLACSRFEQRANENLCIAHTFTSSAMGDRENNFARAFLAAATVRLLSLSRSPASSYGMKRVKLSDKNSFYFVHFAFTLYIWESESERERCEDAWMVAVCYKNDDRLQHSILQFILFHYKSEKEAGI